MKGAGVFLLGFFNGLVRTFSFFLSKNKRKKRRNSRWKTRRILLAGLSTKKPRRKTETQGLAPALGPSGGAWVVGGKGSCSPKDVNNFRTRPWLTIGQDHRWVVSWSGSSLPTTLPPLGWRPLVAASHLWVVLKGRVFYHRHLGWTGSTVVYLFSFFTEGKRSKQPMQEADGRRPPGNQPGAPWVLC